MRTIVAVLLLGFLATGALAEYPPTVFVHFGEVAAMDCGEAWWVPTPPFDVCGARFWLAELGEDDCGEAGLCAFLTEREWLRLNGARLVMDFAAASMFTIWIEIVLADDAAIGGTRILHFLPGDYAAGQPPCWEGENATVGTWETYIEWIPSYGTVVVVGCATRIAEVRIHTEPSPTATSSFGAVKALYAAP